MSSPSKMPPEPPLAAIFSIEGQEITKSEEALFRRTQPLGFILFKRNIRGPEQVTNLISRLREIADWFCPVLIDQEGGRVARLCAPVWPELSPARHFGSALEKAREKEDMQAVERARNEIKDAGIKLAQMLNQSGINVNCAPVLDRLLPETSRAIGDRAYSDDPAIIFECADIMCRAFLENGITPVIKHLPGHGRACTDSHEELPVIKAGRKELVETDFHPFALIAKQEYCHQLWGMTAHVLFSSLDESFPASVSRKIIQDIIRQEIGFTGFLLSDDIDMKGLAGFGDVDKRAKAALQAGTDAVLYCSGRYDDMVTLAQNLPRLEDESYARLENWP